MKPSVTDLDYIVSLGHSETAARDALQITHGNKTAALYLLSKPDTPSNTRAKNLWRKETKDEWVNGDIATPHIAENRAVHKSPIYVFVEHYHTAPEGDEYIFEMEVTMKDGRQWKMGRTYPEFYTLWASLPFGSCASFVNSFPPSAAFQLVFGDLSKSFLQKRLRGLSEWMRELVLNESCMDNPKVLDLLYKFVDLEKNGAKKESVAHPTSPLRPVSMTTKVKSPLLSVTQDSTEAAAALRKKLHFDQAPLLGLENFPVTPDQMMPFKVNLKKLQCYHDIIAIKLSAQTKAAEDEARNAVQKEEEAMVAAAVTESVAAAHALDAQREQEQRQFTEHDSLIERSTSPHTNHNQPTSTEPTIAIPPLAPSAVETKDLDAKRKSLTPSAPIDHTAPRAPSPPVARLVGTTDATMAHDVSLLKKFQNTSMLDLKIDAAQLRKDCSRDRLIVQGKRLNGSDVSLEHIYSLCQDRILQEMDTMGKKFDLGVGVCSGVKKGPSTNPFDDVAEDTAEAGEENSASSNTPNLPEVSKFQQDCEQFSRFALSVLSRTESGYLSHASLSEIFDTENIHQRPDFEPCFFVPESTLSDPLHLTFRVLEKGGAPQALRGKYAQPALAEEWCVECTGETSTVYRLMDAMSLEPLLQIRVIFQVTLFGMPQYAAGTSRASPDATVVGLTVKEGKCHILVDKATTTTSRDWKAAV